jgi:hypothetical protein
VSAQIDFFSGGQGILEIEERVEAIERGAGLGPLLDELYELAIEIWGCDLKCENTESSPSAAL